MLLCGKLLTFLFVNTILATIYYWDDGTCSDLSTNKSCDDASALRGLITTCKWVAASEACTYEGPESDILVTLILTTAAVVLSVPYNRLLEHTFATALKSLRHKGIMRGLGFGDDSDMDEFTYAETLQLRLLTAARITKYRESLEFKSPLDEAQLIMRQPMPSDGDPTNESMYEAIVHRHTILSLSKVVKQVRKECDGMLLKDLVKIVRSVDRERYLMQSFLVYSVPDSNYHPILHHLMSGYNEVNGVLIHSSSKYLSVLCATLFVAHFLLMSCIVYRASSRVDSSSVRLWLMCLGGSILVFTVVLEAIIILVKNVFVLNHLVGGEIHSRCMDLCARARVVLRRTAGLMRHSNAPMQHLNAACRVACLATPELPVARLLIALSDQDLLLLPSTLSKKRTPFQYALFDKEGVPEHQALVARKTPTLAAYLGSICSYCLLLVFSFVPFPIGEVLFDIVFLTGATGLVFGFYFLAQHGTLYAIITAVLLVAGVPLCIWLSSILWEKYSISNMGKGSVNQRHTRNSKQKKGQLSSSFFGLGRFFGEGRFQKVIPLTYEDPSSIYAAGTVYTVYISCIYLMYTLYILYVYLIYTLYIPYIYLIYTLYILYIYLTYTIARATHTRLYHH